MKPIDFPQSTKVLQRPSTMAESECQSLHVWNDGNQCVSCWKPTVSERIRIAFGGNVWLGLLLGCIAGAIKEWWDSKGHGAVELMDFVFTCFGSLVAFPIAWIINILIW